VNKKKQKNFDSLGDWERLSPNPTFSRSFLLLFFKKEALAFLSHAAPAVAARRGGVAQAMA